MDLRTIGFGSMLRRITEPTSTSVWKPSRLRRRRCGLPSPMATTRITRGKRRTTYRKNKANPQPCQMINVVQTNAHQSSTSQSKNKQEYRYNNFSTYRNNKNKGSLPTFRLRCRTFSRPTLRSANASRTALFPPPPSPPQQVMQRKSTLVGKVSSPSLISYQQNKPK